MSPIQFVHLPQSVLGRAAQQAMVASPLYTGAERARIAALLRRRLHAGLDSPRGLQRALGQGLRGVDGRVRRFGDAGTRRLLRPASRLRLPSDLAAPLDPRYESTAARAVLHNWTVSLVRNGALSGTALRNALASGGRGLVSAIDNACEAQMGGVFGTLPAACRDAGVQSRENLAWVVHPSCTYGWSDPSTSVVVAPGPASGANWFGVTWVEFDATHPDCVPLCGVLGTLPMRIVSVLAPQDVIDSGLGFNSQVMEDIAVYLDTAVRQDGSIVIPDELRQHLAMEYGWEADEHDEAIAQYLRYCQRDQAKFAGKRDASAAIAALRAHAIVCRDARRAEPLLAIAALAEWLHAQSFGKQPQIEHEPLSEEDYAPGLHAIGAKLAGFDYDVLNEVYEAQMQNGSDGAVEVRGDDPWKVLQLCNREACAITVLVHLLNNYSEAIS